MSAECWDPGPDGPQGWSLGSGGHSGASGSSQCPPLTMPAPWSLPRWRAYLAAAVLCYINLLNYMNWFIIAGVLLDVQKFFQISDSSAGLLQTVFISCLLLSAPVFGYLGDRHSRKATLSFGILLWSGAGLSSSFISPQYSWLFFLFRGAVGTGTASYSTIAPTVLGDLFVRDQRTRVLAIFYIFIPVGRKRAVLPYLPGHKAPQAPRPQSSAQPRISWFSGEVCGPELPGPFCSQILPCLEAVALILLIALVPDPPRGAAEKQGEVAMRDLRSSWCADIRYLGRNWSFVLSTLGVTAMAFVTGALGFWAPTFLFEARVVHGLQLPCLRQPCNNKDRLQFLTSPSPQHHRKTLNTFKPSLFFQSPCPFLAQALPSLSRAVLGATFLASYVFLALGELLLSCNWAVVADILLSVVVPRCRGTAEALQITVGHILGDAGSPYLTGLISSALRARRPDSYLQRFLSLQQSFLCCTFVIALGGGCFLLAALHLEGDQDQARQPDTGIPDSKEVDSKDMERLSLLSGTRTSTEDP
ncbi:protein spinster homolog 3 [Pteropus vampyrus]|uniref:Protein spinster homolog 3 n=1 Tax=Pteropus vampyrus TaxID=132908 RepID=A0A6P6CFB9_PTEVA|nr:protein spinster homolog 3 [Pteropus vampyrus]